MHYPNCTTPSSELSPREGGSWGIDMPVPSSQSLVKSCPGGTDPLALLAYATCWPSVLPQPETKPSARESQASSVGSLLNLGVGNEGVGQATEGVPCSLLEKGLDVIAFLLYSEIQSDLLCAFT